MKILHISASPCAGSIAALSSAINDHHGDEVQSVHAGISGKVGSLAFDEPDIFVWETGFLPALIEATHVILHNYVGVEEQPIADIMLARQDLRVGSFYHSHPDHVNLDNVRSGYPCFVPAQFQAQLFAGAMPIRQAIRFDRADWPREEHRPTGDRLVVGYAPTTHAKQEGKPGEAKWYDSKGFEWTDECLQELEDTGAIEYRLIEGTRYDMAIRLKAQCDVLIDEIVTGSYHRSALEGLALGKVTISGIDPAVDQIAKDACGDVLPLHRCRDFDTLGSMLLDLAEDRAKVQALGVRNKNWMQKHWHPRDVAADFLGLLPRLPTVAEVTARMEAEHGR